MAQYTLKIALAAKGDFSAESTYALLDVVRYNDASWVCRKAVTEAGEWNDENWQLLVQDGEDGAAAGFEVVAVEVNTLDSDQQANGYTIMGGDAAARKVTFVLNIPRGEDGKDGVTPTFSLGGVTTGEAGTSAVGVLAQEVTENGELKYVLSFQIPRGDKGETGEGFSIYKTYSSVDEMNADATNVEEGKFVLIASDVEDEDNAKLYVKGAETFSYLTDLSGAQGIKGEKGDKGDPGSDGTNAVFKILTDEPSTSDLDEGEVAFVVEE